jgi:hypothetical protein
VEAYGITLTYIHTQSVKAETVKPEETDVARQRASTIQATELSKAAISLRIVSYQILNLHSFPDVIFVG